LRGHGNELVFVTVAKKDRPQPGIPLGPSGGRVQCWYYGGGLGMRLLIAGKVLASQSFEVTRILFYDTFLCQAPALRPASPVYSFIIACLRRKSEKMIPLNHSIPSDIVKRFIILFNIIKIMALLSHYL
jgi:hypothetical protein